jgi:hypothetical protein
MALRIFPPVTAVLPTGRVVLREPFNRGLVAAFAPGLGAGLTDLVHGLTLNQTQDSGSVGGGTSGLSGAAIVTLPDYLKLALPITVVTRLSFTAAPATAVAIFDVSHNDSLTNPYVAFGFGVDGSGYIRMHWNSAGTFAEFNGGGSYQRLASQFVGCPVTIEGVFTAGGNTLYFGPDIGWYYGVGQSNPTYSATAQLRMGYAGTNVCVEYGLIYNRYLTPNETALFRSNPYHWVQPSTAKQFALGAPAAPAGISLVATSTKTSTGILTTDPIDTTGANLLVMSSASYNAGTPTSISDSKGNTWTTLTTRAATSGATHCFFYAKNATVGSGHTFTISAPFQAVIVYAFAGVDTTSPFDVENGATGSSPLATGSVTPSVNGALVLSGYANDSSSSIAVSGGSFTQTTVPYSSGANMAGAAGYLVQATATAINPSWSWTGSATAAVATVVFLAGTGITAATIASGSALTVPSVTAIPALAVLANRQYTAPSAADAVSITPAAVAWTNSAYAELLAATSATCVLTGVTVHTTHGVSSSVAYDFEVDIATGAAGAEVVIATVRGYNARSFASVGNTGPTLCYTLPIPIDNIASGARLSARLRKNNTATTPVWMVAIAYLQKPLASTILTTAVAQKALPPAAVGVTVTANATPWANGAWVQLRAASGAALVITGVVFGGPSVAADYELDLGIGGSGSETVITTIRATGVIIGFPSHLMLPTPLDNVAAGTRVAARLRCSSASRTMVVSLMVLEKPL